ncbi:hypothetical protein OPT61_g4754 [Boeremia exigua]|uniref:Uncharacterized protein n=1 Tax=Boeremia exigua TaxID=749465 RepID=A0ACC2ICX7_9PLEO|nr:hypothetical protein OPT61_g4754 [Boeremia exigua]
MAESNGPKIIVTLWVLTIIPLLFMLLRFYCKVRYSKVFGWDDTLLAVAWVLSLLYTVYAQICVGYGIGEHFNDIEDKTRLPTGIKYMYISETFGLISVPLSKASFCVTLLRLTVIPWQKQLLWFILITVQITFYAAAIMTLVQCDPIPKLWDLALPGKCWDNRIVIYFCIFVGAYSSLMDFLLAICPWIIIHKLQMRRREKWSIIFAMSLGCLAGVACIVKTTYLPLIGTWADFTYNIADVLIWAMTESAITIVAASIPFMRLMMQDLTSRGGSRGRSYGNTGSYQLKDRPSAGHSIGTKTEIKAQPAAYYKDTTRVKSDDQSDRSILRDAKDAENITQTREVTIAYSESGDDASNDDRLAIRDTATSTVYVQAQSRSRFNLTRYNCRTGAARQQEDVNQTEPASEHSIDAVCVSNHAKRPQSELTSESANTARPARRKTAESKSARQPYT